MCVFFGGGEGVDCLDLRMTSGDLHELLVKRIEELEWMFVVVKLDQKIGFVSHQHASTGHQVTANNPKDNAVGTSINHSAPTLRKLKLVENETGIIIMAVIVWKD